MLLVILLRVVPSDVASRSLPAKVLDLVAAGAERRHAVLDHHRPLQQDLLQDPDVGRH